MYRTQRQGSKGPQEPCVVSGVGAPLHEPFFWPGWHPSPGRKDGGVGRRAGTYLGASIHKEDSGVLLPWLHSVGLVEHAVEPHV